MSPIPVRVLETGQYFPSFSAAVWALTGRPPHGRDHERFTLGRTIAGMHLVPDGDEDWEPDPTPCRRERPVRSVENGKIWPSLSCAARRLGVPVSAVYRAIQKRRPLGGFHWTYAEDAPRP